MVQRRHFSRRSGSAHAALLFLLLVVCFTLTVVAAAGAEPVDVTPPATVCTAPAGWQNASFSVTFTATDDASGVASTWAALDGAPLEPVADPGGAGFAVPAPADHSFDGVHTVSYSSIDGAGNVEPVRTVDVRIDTRGPATFARAAVGYRGRAVSLQYRVDDALSATADVTLVVRNAAGMAVRTFALSSQTMGSWHRVTWRPAAAGRFTAVVTAADQAGNREPAAGHAAVTVRRLARLVIGRSVRGRAIRAIQFGAGQRLLIVAGTHGNEAGTPVARQFVTYLLAHPRAVPDGSRIDIIACLNPDGWARHLRGNARHVDLNRNLPSANWRHHLSALNEPGGTNLTGGSRPGSEPENKALLRYLRIGFRAVVSLHSRAGILDCQGPGSRTLGRRMSARCGLPVARLWYDPYITGSLGHFVPERYRIPIVTVELRRAKLGAGMRAALLVAAR